MKQCSSVQQNDPERPICVLTSLTFASAAKNPVSEIDLSNGNINLNSLPSSLGGLVLEKVKKLNVSGNHLAQSGTSGTSGTMTLPAFVSQFQSLTVLDLANVAHSGLSFDNWGGSNNSLENIWNNNLALTYLDVSDNFNLWPTSNETFKQQLNLQTLKMSHCCMNLSGHSSLFRDLNNLEYLDISGNHWLSPARSALHPMGKLKYLDISRTNATFDPSSFFEPLSNLETVFLENVNQQNLNVYALNFSSEKIRQLSLRENRLSGLVEKANLFGLKNSSALEYLDLSNVEISPSEEKQIISSLLEHFGNLKFLNVSGSATLIKNLSSSLFRHNTKLERLDMSRLELWDTNCENERGVFENLNNLQELTMQFSTLRRIDGGKCETYLPKEFELISSLGKHNLRHVDLSFSQNFLVRINSTSSDVSFQELRHLNLSGGSFPSVELSGLKKLETLDLSGIHTESVKLSDLQSVTFLNFSSHLTYPIGRAGSNSETIIDVLEISDLSNLTWVDLSNSKFNRISFHNLPKLEHIHFHNSCAKFLNLENNEWESIALLHAAQVLRSGTLEITIKNITNLKNLTLSNHQCSINKIDVRHSPNLESINFSNVSIDIINLENLRLLKSLNISASRIMNLTFIDLPELPDLDLSSAKIQVNSTSSDESFLEQQQTYLSRGPFPFVEVSGLKKLETLNLSGIQSENVKLSDLQSVKFLNLSSHLASETIIDVLDISDLVNLTWVDLSNSKFNRILFHNLPKLEHMYFQNSCAKVTVLENNDWEFPALFNAAEILRSVKLEITIKNLTNLKDLTLSNHDCGITKLDVRDSPKLEVINFFNVTIDVISLENLSSLNSLNMSKSSVMNLTFHDLPKLQDLDLSSANSSPIQINSTSRNVSFPELRHLTLSRGSFPSVELSGLNKLEVLDLSGIQAGNVKLLDLQSVNFLNFSSHRTYPSGHADGNSETNIDFLEISGLNNLTWVDLSNSKFNRINFHNLPKLERIYFYNSCVKVLDVEDAEWESLALLNAAEFLRSVSLEITIKNLTNLKNLTLSNHHCGIGKLDVRESPNLEVIDFFNVSMDVILLENLGSLTTVNTSGSRIMNLTLNELPKLQYLILSNSNLEKAQVRSVPSLTNLDMSFTDGEKLIPQLNISQLKNLTHLNLSSCNLIRMPGNLSTLEDLRSLDLSHNLLYSMTNLSLPPSGKCKLVNLNLSHNSIQIIPSEVIMPMIDPLGQWRIDLGNNLLNCSDCQNSWMSSESFSANIQGALCQTPSGKYHQKIQDVEICADGG